MSTTTEEVRRETDNPWHFDHAVTEVRWRTKSNGVTCHVVQCMACGSALREVKKTDAKVAAFDELLQSFWRAGQNKRWEQRQQAREEAHQAEQDSWRFFYDAYLLSREWRIKRSLVLKRAHGKCEGCGLEDATQVHHLTYAHLGDEFLWELRAVCRACHERVHGKGGE